MADIAFLLLIFFLVTSMIPNDKGISRKLPPPCPPGIECSADILPRNLFQIFLNEQGELLVNNNLTPISELGQLLLEFIDNNGDGSCSYCNGKGSSTASDNPSKAVISLSTDRLTPYAEFIAVHDEITQAYVLLRKNYATQIFRKELDLLTELEFEQLRKAYPFLISEAELK
jgi:biopolymer transport protein ExbD